MYEKLKKLSEDTMNNFTKNPDTSDWYEGSETYFESIYGEITEAQKENKEKNNVYLEDELWDMLWCQLMLLQSLKQEWKITSIDAVLERAYNKFSERVWVDGTRGTSNQGEWKKIKKWQKQRLKKEHENKYGK